MSIINRHLDESHDYEIGVRSLDEGARIAALSAEIENLVVSRSKAKRST